MEDFIKIQFVGYEGKEEKRWENSIIHPRSIYSILRTLAQIGIGAVLTIVFALITGLVCDTVATASTASETAPDLTQLSQELELIRSSVLRAGNVILVLLVGYLLYQVIISCDWKKLFTGPSLYLPEYNRKTLTLEISPTFIAVVNSATYQGEKWFYCWDIINSVYIDEYSVDGYKCLVLSVRAGKFKAKTLLGRLFSYDARYWFPEAHEAEIVQALNTFVPQHLRPV